MPLPVNQVIDALQVPLAERPLPVESTLSGTPRVGFAVVDSLSGAEIGLWELTPSVTLDVEVDEVFVVLSGEATVHFLDGGPPLELRVGSVVRLAGGSRTRWEVRQTLRKLFIA